MSPQDNIFLNFPLDDYYCELLEQLKEEYDVQGRLYSFRQLLETELLKLELSIGLETIIGEGKRALVLDPPKNAQRIPVRIKNKKLLDILLALQTETNRSMPKIIYTLVRRCLDDYADVVSEKTKTVSKKTKGAV